MIGSALGISPERVNAEWLQNNRFQMGIVGKNNGKANDLWQIRKYEGKQIKAYEKGMESTPYKTAVIVRELLYASEFALYLHFEKREDYDLVLKKMGQPEWALSLGREDELILVLEIKEVNLVEKAEMSFSNTVLPDDLTISPYDIDITALSSSSNIMNEAPNVVKLPITFSYNVDTHAREADKFQTFSFIHNMPVTPKGSNGFFDEE
jgi:hypothetical protein